jgi:hypothetical protein
VFCPQTRRRSCRLQLRSGIKICFAMTTRLRLRSLRAASGSTDDLRWAADAVSRPEQSDERLFAMVAEKASEPGPGRSACDQPTPGVHRSHVVFRALVAERNHDPPGNIDQEPGLAVIARPEQSVWQCGVGLVETKGAFTFLTAGQNRGADASIHRFAPDNGKGSDRDRPDAVAAGGTTSWKRRKRRR